MYRMSINLVLSFLAVKQTSVRLCNYCYMIKEGNKFIWKDIFLAENSRLNLLPKIFYESHLNNCSVSSAAIEVLFTWMF